MTPHRAIDAAQAKPSSLIFLGRKERLEAAFLDLLAHSDPRIRHSYHRPTPLNFGANGDDPALRNRINRIEQQVGKGLAQLHFIARDGGNIAEFGANLDVDAGGERLVLPPRLGQVDNLQKEIVEHHGGKNFVLFAVAIELAQPANNARAVLSGCMNHFQIVASLLRLHQQLRLHDQQFRKPKNRGERIVEIMRDPIGHAPKGQHSFALDYLLLRLFQLAEGRGQLPVAQEGRLLGLFALGDLLLEPLVAVAQGGRAILDPLFGLFVRPPQLRLDSFPFESVSHGTQQQVIVNVTLDQVILRPKLHRLDRQRHIVESGKDHDRQYRGPAQSSE